MTAGDDEHLGDGGARTVAKFDAAVAALRAGGVVAIPTDTVYGLAVDPSCPGATDRLFALKERPVHVDLPVLVASVGQADELAGPDGLSPMARVLADAFWPGSLTIVVERRHGLDWVLGEHERTIGLRCPADAMIRSMCELVGPIATTSANLHGRPPCTAADEVRDAFGDRLAAVVAGGRRAGVASTVVELSGPSARCARTGAVAWEDVVAVVDRFVSGSR